MKILVSAFACAPNAGSEGGVGWRWALELAREHEVVVITDVVRRPAIEVYLAAHPQSNPRFEYFRPWWLRRIPLNSFTAQLLYTGWQFGLLLFAKTLNKQVVFDFAIHITYSVFRHPSFLGFMGIPFIFGPLGGGEDAPYILKRSIKGREKIKEILRAVLNKFALIDPTLWLAYSRSTLILTSTSETQRALPWPFRKRAIVYPNLGVEFMIEQPVSNRAVDEPMRVLFVGRLLGWKGAHLAIRAVANVLSHGVPIEFTLVGRGPYEAELHKIAQELGVADDIKWITHLPQNELLVLYRSMHCFLFPSLHDSGGTVVLEAQVNGLPVICLDLGGPATLVTADTAIVVPTRGLDESGVVEELARAMKKLAVDEERRRAMARAAIAHTRTNMSWEKRVRGVLALVEASRHAT